MVTLTNKQKGLIKVHLDQVMNNAKLAKLDVENAMDSLLAVRSSTDRLISLLGGPERGQTGPSDGERLETSHIGNGEPALPIPDLDAPGTGPALSEAGARGARPKAAG